MNGPLFRQTWRAQRLKLMIVSTALGVWGFCLPVIYARFGAQFKAVMDSGLFPEQFARLGNGDIFSLSGSIALSFIHPITIGLTSVFSIGFAATAIAGERQRGTLEVALARPLSRRTFYLTIAAATLVFLAIIVASLLAGGIAGSLFSGVARELALRNLPRLWLNGVLLFGAFAAVGLAASVSFDRVSPALGVTIGFIVVMYFIEILGSLWPEAERFQPWSFFHYLRPKAILLGEGSAMDPAVLAAVIVLAMAWALVVFPRRDLAAPS